MWWVERAWAKPRRTGPPLSPSAPDKIPLVAPTVMGFVGHHEMKSRNPTEGDRFERGCHAVGPAWFLAPRAPRLKEDCWTAALSGYEQYSLSCLGELPIDL
jgi:hypothetical protein